MMGVETDQLDERIKKVAMECAIRIGNSKILRTGPNDHAPMIEEAILEILDSLEMKDANFEIDLTLMKGDKRRCMVYKHNAETISFLCSASGTQFTFDRSRFPEDEQAELADRIKNHDRYPDPLPDYGDLMTVKEFIECCECGGFVDDDGSGNPVKDGKMDKNTGVYPSELEEIPEDATHIMWYNR